MVAALAHWVLLLESLKMILFPNNGNIEDELVHLTISMQFCPEAVVKG
jgi:hypothetical protein